MSPETRYIDLPESHMSQSFYYQAVENIEEHGQILLQRML